MARWTRKQVEKLAPDERSIKAARGLARPGPWSDVGATDTLVWGKCQGSGKSAYQVSVDLTGPAFKCTCPSRKFPCKHGLALLMAWADGGGTVASVTEPADFARDWADARTKRGLRKKSGKQPDPEAQAKRLEERLAKMDAGMADFETWLLDLARSGLAAARVQPVDYWERAAARLVDAQLPGLADRVRRTAALLAADDRWVERLLDDVARWYLAAKGWQNRTELTEDLAADLRTYLGWARASSDVAEDGKKHPGPWTVLGVSEDETGRILTQRTWLLAADGTHAVVLDFAAAGGSLGVGQVVGSVIESEVTLYPGAQPARAMLPEQPDVSQTVGELSAPLPIESNLEAAANWIGANPFAGALPVTLASVIPRVTEDEFWLVDSAGSQLPVSATFVPWPLLVHMAGGPVDVFGEWDGEHFKPLTVASDDELVPL